MKEDSIKIFGARVHNLKNVDLEIPRRKLVVITGLGLGQVVAGFRHDLRRGTAPLHGDPLDLRARQFVGTMERPT